MTPSNAVATVMEARIRHPETLAEALASRQRPAGLPDSKLLIIAADHPARGALSAGPDPRAMMNRWELLERVRSALEIPGVHGYLGTSDSVEDLALLGALEDKFVFGSLNRGGLAGSNFEMDDRMTGYDAEGCAAAGLEGGKMLVRVDLNDAGSVATLEAAGRAVSQLGRAGLISMLEPFISERGERGEVRNRIDTESVALSVAIASGLGAMSNKTWLKLPLTDDFDTVAQSTTMPILVLGGAVSNDADAAFERWERALDLPNVIGLVVGRSLLYPPNGGVEGAVRRAAELTQARPLTATLEGSAR